jgi:peptide/nickel transport system ATP-binding protein
MAMLDIEGLTVDYRTREGVHHVLKGVDLCIYDDEIVGLIGESGSGKSTLAMTVMDINRHERTMSGEIKFMGRNIVDIDKEKMRDIRGRHIGFIPQSAMNALDPLVTVKKQFLETIHDHVDMPHVEAMRLIRDSLSKVSVDPGRMDSFPYEFSGGQRQRLMIALAMLLSPELIIADEPTTALDATVQSRIVELLKETARQKHSSMLVISHDLHTISRICDRIYIMYAGRVVESGTREEIMEHPMHPYTKKLLSTRLRIAAEPVRVKGIPGNPPSTLKLYDRCEFYERCEVKTAICTTAMPPCCSKTVKVSCHLRERI